MPEKLTDVEARILGSLVEKQLTTPEYYPLTINGLTLKNRVVRSSLGGRVDYYDGSMSDARIAWDTRFARGGITTAAPRPSTTCANASLS